jgi:hypothetical protein
MTYATVRAAAEHLARVGSITPHQLAALTALDQGLTDAQRQAFTELWRAEGSPAAAGPALVSMTQAAAVFTKAPSASQLADLNACLSRFNINTWTLSGTGPDVNGAPRNFVYETGTSYRFSVIAVNEVSSILLPASLGTPVADMDITSLFTLNTASVNGTGGWQSPTPASWNMSVRIGTDGKSIDIIVVPEPGTLVLVGIGAACAAWAARRRRA